jgi:hypothetical protein
MGFNSTPLCVTYNVAVDSQRYARIRMTHLLLHHTGARTAVEQGACCPMPSSVKSPVRNAQPLQERMEMLLPEFLS